MELENKLESPKIEEKKKPKVKIWEKWFKKKNLEKPQMVAVVYLRKNNTAETLEVDTKKGFFEIDGHVYHTERDCMYSIGKERLPFAVIKEEGLIPEPNKDFYENLKKLNGFERMCETFQHHVIKAIRYAELVKMSGEENKMKLDPKIVIGGIAGLVVLYLLFKQFGGA